MDGVGTVPNEVHSATPPCRPSAAWECRLEGMEPVPCPGAGSISLAASAEARHHEQLCSLFIASVYLADLLQAVSARNGRSMTRFLPHELRASLPLIVPGYSLQIWSRRLGKRVVEHGSAFSYFWVSSSVSLRSTSHRSHLRIGTDRPASLPWAALWPCGISLCSSSPAGPSLSAGAGRLSALWLGLSSSRSLRSALLLTCRSSIFHSGHGWIWAACSRMEVEASSFRSWGRCWCARPSRVGGPPRAGERGCGFSTSEGLGRVPTGSCVLRALRS